MSIPNSQRGSSRAKADVQIAVWAFNVWCPGEDDAVEYLYLAMYGDDSQHCPRCESQDIHRQRGKRMQKCGGCNYSWSFTTNTYFQGAHKLRPGLMALTLASSGMMLSSPKLASLTGVAQSTAYGMNKKVALVFKCSFPFDTESIASSHLKDVIGKRSFETPARRPPLSEQEELEKSQQHHHETSENGSTQESTEMPFEEAPRRDFDRKSAEGVDQPLTNAAADSNSRVDNFGVEREPQGEPMKSKTLVQDKDALAPDIYDYIGEKCTNVDRLCIQTGLPVEHVQVSLLMLQLDGKIEQVTPGAYVRCAIDPPRAPDSSDQPGGALSEEQKLAVALFKSHVSLVWHAVSQKCLQTYVALSWACSSPDEWTLELLLDKCIKFGRITNEEVRNYVSPYMVKLPGLA